MTSRAEKEKTPVKIICPDCGKPKISKGSITGWLFSEKHCTCLSGGLRLTPMTPASAAAPYRELDAETLASLPDDSINENYQFLEWLGRGGMGSVYKVRDLVKNRDFAVKILNAEMAGDPEAMKRFYKECEALAQLNHPHVVAVYGHGQTEKGYPYLIMDYIDGYSLADVLDEESYLSPGRALGLFVPVAEALAFAHKEGILHRDLKPGNIMLTRSETEETIRLVDFGIAKVLEGNSRMTQDLTETGEVLGTPLYMSPEQCLGFQLDERSDIYSLGCLMCEVITGKPPFAGDNAMQIVAHHLSEAPFEAEERLINMGTPEGLQEIILTCIAKDANDRYPNMELLVEDLHAVVAGRRPSHSTTRMSHRLRSPYVGIALEAVPFSVPATIFALLYAFVDFDSNRMPEHCNVAAIIAGFFLVYYLIKCWYLRASSSLLDKRGLQYKRRFAALTALIGVTFLFAASQALILWDCQARLAEAGVEKMRITHPWYFVLLWLILAAVPFVAPLFIKGQSDK